MSSCTPLSIKFDYPLYRAWIEKELHRLDALYAMLREVKNKILAMYKK